MLDICIMYLFDVLRRQLPDIHKEHVITAKGPQ